MDDEEEGSLIGGGGIFGNGAGSFGVKMSNVSLKDAELFLLCRPFFFFCGVVVVLDDGSVLAGGGRAGGAGRAGGTGVGGVGENGAEPGGGGSNGAGLEMAEKLCFTGEVGELQRLSSLIVAESFDPSRPNPSPRINRASSTESALPLLLCVRIFLFTAAAEDGTVFDTKVVAVDSGELVALKGFVVVRTGTTSGVGDFGLLFSIIIEPDDLCL